MSTFSYFVSAVHVHFCLLGFKQSSTKHIFSYSVTFHWEESCTTMQNLSFYKYECVFFGKRELSLSTVILILILLAIIVRQQEDM
jgi:hypothetical protein